MKEEFMQNNDALLKDELLENVSAGADAEPEIVSEQEENAAKCREYIPSKLG